MMTATISHESGSAAFLRFVGAQAHRGGLHREPLTKNHRLFAVFAILLLAIAGTTAMARPITRGEARRSALQFLQGQTGSRRLSPAAADTSADETVSPYYVFNRAGNAGFVIVSGDDQAAESILGYCDSGTFDYDKMPPNMREWLDGYAQQLQALQAVAKISPNRISAHPKVPQLMTSQWSQGSPYNDECPMYFTLGRSVTGCVATAYAQIMYYHRSKMVTETQADMPAYYTSTSHATYGQLHVDGIAKGAPIDWDAMTDTYGSSSSARSKKAVAQLMHYCGVAVYMDYTNGASGAYSSQVDDALRQYFGFGNSVRFVSSMSSDEAWDELIYKEVSEGRPVYISGANSEAGHAFVCDGYDGQRRYHINWGWGGTSDGYYYLSNLTPGEQGIGGSGDGYNAYREVIVGIEPENYAERTMPFADATARKLCTEAWDQNGDGKLSFGEAAAVTSLGTVLKASAIKTFNELHYFTGLADISAEAFMDCQRLTEVQLPSNIKRVDECAFKGCTSLQTLNLPDGLAEIGSEAMSGCTALTDIALPAAVGEVPARAFQGCTSLAQLTLPIGISSLGDGAMSGCTALRDLYIKTMQPQKIALGSGVFSDIDLSQTTLHIMQGTKALLLQQEQWGDFGTVKEQRELSRGNFIELTEDALVYLYHVGSGRYLTKGEAYGTQAVAGTKNPMRFKLSRTASLPEGVYYITSDDTERDGHYLFRTISDPTVGSGVEAVFVDGTSSTQASQWAVKSVGDNTYTISIPEGRARYNAAWRLGVDNAHKSNFTTPTWGVYSDIVYEGNKASCQWRLVPYDAYATANFEAAQALEGLIATALAKNVKCSAEQAVLDRLESSTDELLAAQQSLRKKLKLIDFADATVAQRCRANFDLDADGELSQAEAAMASELSEYTFQSSDITSFNEFRYFSSVPDVYGNSFAHCTKLVSITLPESIERIYYQAFMDCTSLTAIELPEYVSLIGDKAFNGCTALKTVQVGCPDPKSISVASNAFQGVDTKQATLLVPAGSKDLYAAAAVWGDFGTIKEVRTNLQPKTSEVTPGAKGYIMNVGTRKYLSKGEAYGTQAIVARKGLPYIWNGDISDSIFHLYSSQAGGDGVLFRTSTDKRVGDGVKACFADGSLSEKANWQLRADGDGVYTLQVPAKDATYKKGQYLGIDANHKSDAASPTFGLYWDVDYASNPAQCQWVFIAEDDMKAVQEQNNIAKKLKQLLETAADKGIETRDEQAVYDNIESSTNELQQAVLSLRNKLHYITFTDTNARLLCLEAWDDDEDGELTWEEAAAVTSLGEMFRNKSNIKHLNELRYFTGLTFIPENAFRGMSSMVSLTLPENISEMGQYAFVGCSALRYLAITNPTAVVPMGSSVVSSQVTIFVPEQLVDAYSQDEKWTKNTVIAYTGIPVVTAAPLARPYGTTRGNMTYTVSGAPIEGEPELVCQELEEPTTPVGTYAIHALPGTITTPGLICADGELTIEPYTLTVTAKSYSRQQGEPNPDFEVTYRGFRNHETYEVLSRLPVVTCEADANSPAGTYDIVPSGAEAHNYTFKYVSGVLTVTAPDGIVPVTGNNETGKKQYDLLGRPARKTSGKGVYVKGGKKTINDR